MSRTTTHSKYRQDKPLFPQRAWNAHLSDPDKVASETYGGNGDNTPARERYRRFAANAIRFLPPGQREAVRLYYLEGIKMPEAAKILGVSRSTVSRRLAAARKTLRELARFCTDSGFLPP
ncbi:RNA polymerase sigma factor [Anaerotruncus rubiinfantis]|uniref:RNA polymerase sigma factor n=1 Tax=Anaerotruncus rubiinfantis TaxID=1720200 RepID=UPI0031191797